MAVVADGITAHGGAARAPVLELRGLVKRYGNIEVLGRIDIAMQKGRASGAGGPIGVREVDCRIHPTRW